MLKISILFVGCSQDKIAAWAQILARFGFDLDRDASPDMVLADIGALDRLGDIASRFPDTPLILHSDRPLAAWPHPAVSEIILSGQDELLVALARSALRERRIRRDLDEQVRKKEEELALNRVILDSAAEGIIGTDRTGRQVFVNPAAARILGYDPAEMIGRDGHALWHHSHADGSPYPADECSNLRAIREGGSVTTGYETYWHKDGTRIPVEFSVAPVRVGGKITGSVLVFHDIAPLRRALVATVEAMQRISETRDPYTAGHEQRVAELAMAIGKQMRLKDQMIEGLYFSGALHDIGKCSVPIEILNRPGRLNIHQLNLVRHHVVAGHGILEGCDLPWPVATVALQHHERIDGSGYPHGRKGDALAVESRIVAVADTIEAMMSHRPYRPGLGLDRALQEITQNRGSGFDETVVDAALAVFARKESRPNWVA